MFSTGGKVGFEMFAKFEESLVVTASLFTLDLRQVGLMGTVQ